MFLGAEHVPMVGGLGDDGVKEGGFLKTFRAKEMAGEFDDQMDKGVAAGDRVLTVGEHEVEIEDETADGLPDASAHTRRGDLILVHLKDFKLAGQSGRTVLHRAFIGMQDHVQPGRQGS